MHIFLLLIMIFLRSVDAAVVVTPDNNTHDIQKLLHKKRPDSADSEILKAKHVGEVFYAPLSLIRPGICRFPFLSLELHLRLLSRDKPRLATKIPFDEGRAIRDKNNAKSVVMGIDHRFLVYADNYNDLLHDMLAGATTMPVRIVADYSDIHDDHEFWKTLISKDYAYLDDLEGEMHLPPDTMEGVKDDPYLTHWMLLIPEVFNFSKQPRQRVIAYVDYPAAIRIEGRVPKFSLYKLTKKLYDVGFKDKELMQQPPKKFKDDFLKDIQKRVYQAFFGGNMYGIDWIHTFDEETKFSDIDFFKLGLTGQVYIMPNTRSTT